MSDAPKLSEDRCAALRTEVEHLDGCIRDAVETLKRIDALTNSRPVALTVNLMRFRFEALVEGNPIAAMERAIGIEERIAELETENRGQGLGGL